MAMRRRKERAAGILAAAILTCVTLAIAQVRRPPLDRPGAFETVRDSRLIGAHVVRLINTAELDYSDAHGSFAEWNALYRSGAVVAAEKRSSEGTGLGPGPEVVPGWFLSIVVSPDGKSYQLSLRNIDDKQCRFSFFSDASGLIYQGNVIDCPVM
jgi:hypothetical protein